MEKCNPEFCVCASWLQYIQSSCYLYVFCFTFMYVLFVAPLLPVEWEIKLR